MGAALHGEWSAYRAYLALDEHASHHREAPRPFEELSVAIVGDIKHSRVARSDISAMQTLGVKDIRVCAPRTLLPKGIERFGVQVYEDMNE